MANSKIRDFYVPCAAALYLTCSLLAGARPCAAAMGGESFSSPEQAAKALVAAAETGDKAKVLKILGPSAADLVTTSDSVEDRNVRDAFVAKAREKMAVVADPNTPGQKILEIGDDRWPFPIPLVQFAGAWRFDVAKGRRQILLRRIGDNELTALDMCRGFVEAQHEYFERQPAGSPPQYAQRFFSTPGNRDGLYWPAADGADESPVGELVAKAIAEGYTDRNQPYHGYHYKILKEQGPNVTGGAMSYIKDGAMTGGFALIAWPADYGRSGVMTFIVDRSGIVYQKDLGEKTADLAAATTAYDPDRAWTPVAGSGVSASASAKRRVSATRR